MSREKKDKGDTEMNVHSGEIENAELDPEKERRLDPVGRTRRINMQDREDVEAEETYQARRSFGDYLARVSTVTNQVKISIAEARECEEVREAGKNLEQAWARYRNVELKKLMAKRALELAQDEAEMEKRKIDIEMQKEKIAREMRFQVQLEEKEVDLLALEDYDSASNEENSVVKNDCDPGFSLEPQLPKQERTASWVVNCQQETKPLSPKAV